MWLATQHGFYSIVQKAPDEFHVRSRLKSDLENLIRLVEMDPGIHHWPQADYHFRIIVDRQQFTRIMGEMALALDYPNFKNRIASLPDQREKLDAFHRVWSLLAKLQRD